MTIFILQHSLLHTWIVVHWQCVWNHLNTKNEAVSNQMLSRWYCMVGQNLMVLFRVHNFISFDKISNTTGWNAALNCDWASTVLLMATETHCCASLLTFSVYIDDGKLNENFQIWVHYSIIPVATDFQPSSWQSVSKEKPCMAPESLEICSSSPL